ncbi:anthranilate synthase component I, partial [Listeria monocytogenes]|nr:anthranilate synthase component I [Listeria monocytogenes]
MRKMKKMDADTLTAILAFQRLSGTGKSLLEGAAKDAEAGRYSIIAINPVHEIKVYQHDYYIDGTHQVVADPLKEIELFIEKAREDELELPLDSGAIGYVGYDVIALYEDLGEIPVETRDIPDIRFYVYESFVIMDHQAEELILVQDNCY